MGMGREERRGSPHLLSAYCVPGTSSVSYYLTSLGSLSHHALSLYYVSSSGLGPKGVMVSKTQLLTAKGSRVSRRDDTYTLKCYECDGRGLRW